jgi:hypothetical protein
MWVEEKRGGPSGQPSGGETRRIRNPLSWAVLAAIVLLLPPYNFRDVFDLMLPVSALVFLGFYFANSRFAWHVLALELLIVTPLYVFFSFEWRLQRALHPWIIWVPIIGTVLMAALLFWSRQRYFRYLGEQK